MDPVAVLPPQQSIEVVHIHGDRGGGCMPSVKARARALREEDRDRDRLVSPFVEPILLARRRAQHGKKGRRPREGWTDGRTHSLF